MSKIHRTLSSIFLLLLISTSFYVSALPDGADTCDVEQMAKIGHKTTNIQGTGGYALTTAMSAPGAFKFTIDGPGGSFEGILAYVVDGSGKRLGEFTNLPATLRFKDDCGPSTTVTHKNKNLKDFPFELNWNAPQGTNGKLTVKSLVVVKGYNNWAKLDDVTFDSATGNAESAPANNGGSQNNDTNAQSDGFLQKYALFLIMIGVTTLLYVVGSVTEAMLKRQQVKSRSFAKTINGFENSR
jgi:hypothetical protein